MPGAGVWLYLLLKEKRERGEEDRTENKGPGRMKPEKYKINRNTRDGDIVHY
jgi:hypothetical protein